VRDTGERLAIYLAVMNDLFPNIGFMVERWRRDIRYGYRARAVCRSAAPRFNVVDSRLRDGVGVVAEFVFDAVGIRVFANRIGPDGASILKMDDFRGRRKGCQEH